MMRLFLFDFHGLVKIVRAPDGEQALTEIWKVYPYNRAMLRGSMRELTTGLERLINGEMRPPQQGIIFDEADPDDDTR